MFPLKPLAFRSQLTGRRALGSRQGTVNPFRFFINLRQLLSVWEAPGYIVPMAGELERFDSLRAQSFLSVLPRKSRELGRVLLLRDRVEDLIEQEPGSLYCGWIRSDDGLHGVELNCTGRSWTVNCEQHGSGARCEHAAALIQALLAEFNNWQVQRLSTLHNGQQAVAVSRSLANQEPANSLGSLLVTALGRPLVAKESNYVQKVHRAYIRFLKSKVLNSWEFEELGFRASYGQMNIWPAPPRDEHKFWLYIAHAAKNAGFTLPEFMAPISDTQPIQDELKSWERKKEVEQWNNMLTWQLEDWTSTPANGDMPETDLRAVVSEDGLRLQWKHHGDLDFAYVRKTHISDLRYGHRNERFTMAGELIWSRVQAHLNYDGRIQWQSASAHALAAVKSLLLHADLHPSVVTPEGEPLERRPTALSWRLTPPDTPEGDYELLLAQADGSPPPPVLAALPGSPTLYLTNTAVLEGPRIPAGLLKLDYSNRVPAKALETQHGVALLHALGIDLPERLAGKVATYALKIVITCRLQPIYTGSKTEDCTFLVRAFAEDGMELGWDGQTTWRVIKKARPAKGGRIVAHDRSALSLVAPLFSHPSFKFPNCDPALRVNKAFPEKFAGWLRQVPPAVEVRLEGDLESFASDVVAGRVKLEVEEAGIDWFDLRVLVDVSDLTLTPEEIKLLLNAKGGYVRLTGKGWKRLQFDLNEEEDRHLAQLGLSPRELSAEPQRLHTLQLAHQAAEHLLPTEQVQAVQRRAAEIKARVAPAIPAGITAEMREYQQDGYHFLAYLSENRFGGILADDMGLGKTLQTLAWLLHLRAQPATEPGRAPDPTLVVCPKSVMDNWQAEARRFAPGLRVRVWSPGELGSLIKETASADIHVLNYNQLRSLGESLVTINWLAAVLDEGQYIKNPSSQTAQIARSLRAQNRLILTGTPIENRLMDLWSLMSFAMPGVLGSRAQFGKLYDSAEDPFARQRLSARVRPFLIRRTKTQVAKDLPDRIEEDLFCEIEGEQLALYRAELKNAQQRLLGIKSQKELAEQRFNFLTSLLRLRQICCHPKLVNPSCKESGAKVEALLEQLEPILAENQKVLVFSQFVELLTLVRPLIEARGWKTFYLAGETENRGALVEKFQGEQGPAVFLISLKAGGFGLNLTAASYVVLFDPWWNPAVENQAIDRTHRIGQTSKVIAYRLLIKNSIEEKIRKLQKSKKALSEEILGEEKFSQALTLDDLHFLLEG